MLEKGIVEMYEGTTCMHGQETQSMAPRLEGVTDGLCPARCDLTSLAVTALLWMLQ